MRQRLPLVGIVFGALAVLLASGTWYAAQVSANHPVLVEGEKDFDGDGLIGAAEDTDNATDRVFGTINAALGAANGGANQNGSVIIVTSGRFPEIVLITAANGNVNLEAAPGVQANIDAVLAGSAGNAARQAQPGIIVDAPSNRIVTIRNISSRNWTDGIVVLGNSRVTIDRCFMANNTNFGIWIRDNARVTVANSTITASGFRSGAGVNNAPNPGGGIEFIGNSSGTVAFTTVSGSFATGIANSTGKRTAVGILNVNAFDNNPNYAGISPQNQSFLVP
jgi:parallel beta-helix repeat protein